MNKSISWRKGKKGFTIVELVVVIAVIAILAAVLIPTFVGLIQKANESTAFMDANNLVTTLIPELLDGENDTDLLIFSAKGGKIYVYGFRHDIRRVLPYWNNGTFELASGTSFADQVSAILDGFTQNGSNAGNNQKACVTKRDDVTVDDWRSPDKLAAMLTSNGFNGSTMAIRADYRILDNFFNTDDISSGGCDHNWQEISGTDTATCTEAGTAQVQCSKCKEFGTINTPAKGHDYVYTSSDTTSHTVTCRRCDLNTTEAHTLGTDNKCTKCGYEQVTAKNGLVDGLYYKDDVLYTGTETDDGVEYKFENGRLVITDTYSNADITTVKNANPMYGYYYNINHHITVPDNAKYVTKEIYVDSIAELANNMGQQFKQQLTIETAGYVAKQVLLTPPSLDELPWKLEISILGNNIKGWTQADVEQYIAAVEDTKRSTIPYIIFSADFTAYLTEIGLSADSSGVQTYLTQYENNTLSKTYATYLQEQYGAFSEWTYDKACAFINKDGDCPKINGDCVPMVEPEVIELILKTFYLASYNNTKVAVYDNEGMVNKKSVGTFGGVPEYKVLYYSFEGYKLVNSYENENGILAVEILTPEVNNYWNGRDVCSPTMRIVLTKSE